MQKRVVITLHGIRTRGVWQKELVPLLARAGLIPYALDYGYFSSLSLLRASRREFERDSFIDRYDRIRAETGEDRPSVIAHSFGSKIIADSLLHNPAIRFDKVILCGSIVRNDFDWPMLIARRQVNFVENDYGSKDIWPRVARYLGYEFGDSGVRGFAASDLMLVQRRFETYKHSHYFSRTHFETLWLKTLMVNIRVIRTILWILVEKASIELKLETTEVRACIWCPDRRESFLRIPSDLHVNLDDAEAQRTIAFDSVESVNPGVAEAFTKRVACVLEIGTAAGQFLIPTQSTITANPLLCWTVAIPVFKLDGNSLLGVLCVDGLRPSTMQKLTKLAGDLGPLAREIANHIEQSETWL